MRCVSPIRLYRPNKLKRFEYVPCGRCHKCLLTRRNQWVYRLQQEQEGAITPSLFLTLTYRDESLPLVSDVDKATGAVQLTLIPSLSRYDFQCFMKRMRKSYGKMKYYAVGEYGGRTQRPHYHVILFGFNGDLADIQRVWSLGSVDVGTVTIASIKYVAQYHSDVYSDDDFFPRLRPFCSISNGIGRSFVTDEQIARYKERPDDYYVPLPGGIKVSMPRYYANLLEEEGVIFNKKTIDYEDLTLSDQLIRSQENCKFMDNKKQKKQHI